MRAVILGPPFIEEAKMFAGKGTLKLGCARGLRAGQILGREPIFIASSFPREPCPRICVMEIVVR